MRTSSQICQSYIHVLQRPMTRLYERLGLNKGYKILTLALDLIVN